MKTPNENLLLHGENSLNVHYITQKNILKRFRGGLSGRCYLISCSLYYENLRKIDEKFKIRIKRLVARYKIHSN